MKEFEFIYPETLEGALDELNRLGSSAKLIAGGTDLLLDIEEERCSPDSVLCISHLDELRFIRQERDLIHIGPLTTFRDLEESVLIKEKVPVLYDAAWTMGSPQIRNLATLGGNVGKSSVAADGVTALTVLGASVYLRSRQGDRVLTLDELFEGPGDNCIRSDEIITDIFFRIPEGAHISAFYKLAKRKALGIVDIGGAVSIASDSCGVCTEVSLRGGALSRYPLRFHKAEEFLIGKVPDRETLHLTFPMLSEAVCESLAHRPWEIPYKKRAVVGVFRKVFEQVLERNEGVVL